MVHRLGYRFRLHGRDLPGTPDLVLPRHKTVIFVNGCFWHWHPDPTCAIAGLPKSNLEYWVPKLERTRARDQQHADSLRAALWRVLVIWECELKNPEDVLAQIKESLSANHDPNRSPTKAPSFEVEGSCPRSPICLISPSSALKGRLLSVDR